MAENLYLTTIVRSFHALGGYQAHLARTRYFRSMPPHWIASLSALRTLVATFDSSGPACFLLSHAGAPVRHPDVSQRLVLNSSRSPTTCTQR